MPLAAGSSPSLTDHTEPSVPHFELRCPGGKRWRPGPRYSVHSLFNCPRRWRSTDFLVEEDEEDDEDELEDAFFSRFAP